MATFRPQDHAMGIELQLEELREQQERARVQGRAADVRRLQAEIEDLQTELATTAEILAMRGPDPEPQPRLQDGDKLNRTG